MASINKFIGVYKNNIAAYTLRLGLCNQNAHHSVLLIIFTSSKICLSQYYMLNLYTGSIARTYQIKYLLLYFFLFLHLRDVFATIDMHVYKMVYMVLFVYGLLVSTIFQSFLNAIFQVTQSIILLLLSYIFIRYLIIIHFFNALYLHENILKIWK